MSSTGIPFDLRAMERALCATANARPTGGNYLLIAAVGTIAGPIRIAVAARGERVVAVKGFFRGDSLLVGGAAAGKTSNQRDDEDNFEGVHGNLLSWIEVDRGRLERGRGYRLALFVRRGAFRPVQGAVSLHGVQPPFRRTPAHSPARCPAARGQRGGAVTRLAARGSLAGPCRPRTQWPGKLPVRYSDRQPCAQGRVPP